MAIRKRHREQIWRRTLVLLTLVLLTLVRVASSSAQDERRTAATTVQLPTFGVSVDAQGELTVKSFFDPTGQLNAQRIAAARTRLAAPSEFRKVSLVALERTVKECLEANKPVDESLQYVPDISLRTSAGGSKLPDEMYGGWFGTASRTVEDLSWIAAESFR